MSKSDVKYYEGTNQIEFLHMKEGDVRRHKSNCAYYDKATKRCGKLFSACVGSSHCSFYRLREDVRQEKQAECMNDKILAASRRKQYSEPKSSNQIGTKLSAYLNRVKSRCIVTHLTKGRGIVNSIDGKFIKIQFLDDGDKITCLDAEICMKNKLLREV